MSEHRTVDVLTAFGIGLLVGAAGALLLAPASGKETRKRLEELGHDALDKAREGMESAKEFASNQARSLERAVQEGKQAYIKETHRS